MQTEETRALIKKLYKALAKGDRVQLMELFTEDVEWHMPASVLNGTLKGRETVLGELSGETVKRLFQKGSFSLKVHNIYADGNVAIVQTGTRAVTKAGKDYAIEYAWIYTCRDNRIAQIREYLDTAKSFASLGWTVDLDQ